MLQAYIELHDLGVAHSVEVFDGERLIGGLYGVLLDKVFFGESMFSLEPNASKIAFLALSRLCHDHGIEIIDCQVYNPHLESLGAHLMSRQDFENHLRGAIKTPMSSILPNPLCLLPSLALGRWTAERRRHGGTAGGDGTAGRAPPAEAPAATEQHR